MDRFPENRQQDAGGTLLSQRDNCHLRAATPTCSVGCNLFGDGLVVPYFRGLAGNFVVKPQPLIELRHVTVALNGTAVLRDLSWSLRPGEHWLIRGANGSGKSTFLRLLRGEVWPAPKRGERIYQLDGSTQMTAIEVRRHIALVAPEVQERYLQQEWQMTGRDVIHTGFAQSDLLYVKLISAQRRQAEALSKRLGLESLLDRNMQTLSTGELRKILVARAVVAAPKLLLLDEVCDGLDGKFRRELLAMLEIIAQRGTQIVYTTHRQDETLSVITHVAEFREGRLVSQAKQRQRSGHGVRPRAASVPLAVGTRKGQRDAGGTLIRIENANVFLDRQKVLHNITWELRRGEHWVVLGANGAGKTTFLKLVASDLYPMFGARVSRFEFTADNTIWDLRARIGCVSPLLQTHYRERLTAEEVVVSGFFSSIGLMDKPTAEQLRTARQLFREFDLGHLRTKVMLTLSFGELRKVLTLRALVHRPELLILDEPFDGLDTDSKTDFGHALEMIAVRGTQMIIVTHHLDDLPRCITHGLFLERGRIAAAGKWPAVRLNPGVRRLFPADLRPQEPG
jgi:molybdate transport system ATP-binding protein